MHLDNPDLLEGNIITSGISMEITTTPQAMDVGCLIVGDPYVQFPAIPAGKSRATYESHCPGGCTKTFGGDLNVFSSLLHMHLHGKEMWSTLNDDLIVAAKQFWNFGFQTTQDTSFVLHPGDSMETYCVYDTTKSKERVEFGLASYQEMCMVRV
jgi:hypothetical protein